MSRGSMVEMTEDMAPAAYWIGLASAAAAVLLVRLVWRRPLLEERALRLRPREVVLVLLGLLALGFHCAAMFFPRIVDALPAMAATAASVRALGRASQIAYWLPAAAVVLGLRRVWWPPVAFTALGLAGVGITMFWPFPLRVHLAAIGLTILTLAVVAAGLLGMPQPRPTHA